MIKISIIIPYYNAEPFTSELLDILAPQITDEVEVVLVDDGSPTPFHTDHDFCKVIRKKNGGCASARNAGIENTSGEYMSFLDADDLVPEYFIEKLLQKISERQYDVIDFSWKSLSTSGAQHNYILRSDNDFLPNPSVCTRAFRRAFVGDIRFNEKKDSTEDEDFSRKVGYLYKDSLYLHGAITDYMYFYRTAVTDSKIKRFKAGRMKTKRVTYYFNHVTKDMDWLLEEIKKEDELNEVWLLTNQCDIPELKRYCQIHKPQRMWTHILRGESCNSVEVISVPLYYDVVIYCEYTNKVGGISTFIYEWCKLMRNEYRILFLYDRIDDFQIRRLSKIVDCRKKGGNALQIECKALILNRLTDKIPDCVKYEKTIQLVHCCSQMKYQIAQDRDHIVNVSNAAKESWGDKAKNGVVIHNPMFVEGQKALLLVSATRIGAFDKGENDQRYIKLAKMLNDANIPFIWLNFSDKPLVNAPKNFINMDSRLNVQDYIRRADYLVQLSDLEAYSMSILEALINRIPVICTPIPSAIEQGVKDGLNGYIVPYDMRFDVRKLLNIPKFTFNYNNKKIFNQWKKLINAKPKPKKVVPKSATVHVVVLRNYKDMQLNKFLRINDCLEMPRDRAEHLANIKPSGLVKILEG